MLKVKIKDKSEINKIFSYFENREPNPKTELNYEDNFTLTIAVILSAQATDKSVNIATKELFKNYKTAYDFIKLGEEKLKNYIKSIGLFNSKAKNIIKFCEILYKDYDSIIPNNFDDLIKLPGIGRKTANVVLNCAFDQPRIAVDTHVYRVSRRLGLSAHSNLLKLENDLIENIPKRYLTRAHHWLILHGRYICKAKKPDCLNCQISQYCNFFKENF